MIEDDKEAEQIDTLLATPESGWRARKRAVQAISRSVPIAIVVSEMKGGERIIYANPEFENVSGQFAAEIVGRPWRILSGRSDSRGAERKLGAAIAN